LLSGVRADALFANCCAGRGTATALKNGCC
jgi:hypothetical protein